MQRKTIYVHFFCRRKLNSWNELRDREEQERMGGSENADMGFAKEKLANSKRSCAYMVNEKVKEEQLKLSHSSKKFPLYRQFLDDYESPVNSTGFNIISTDYKTTHLF